MEKVTLNNREQKRLLVLNEVLAGRLTGQEAAAGLPSYNSTFAPYRNGRGHATMLLMGRVLLPA